MELRINTKGVGGKLPNFGFVVFDDFEPVQRILGAKVEGARICISLPTFIQLVVVWLHIFYNLTPGFHVSFFDGTLNVTVLNLTYCCLISVPLKLTHNGRN